MAVGGGNAFLASAELYTPPNLCAGPDLEITNLTEDGPVSIGNDLQYTIDVTNTGPGDATGVTVTDTLPANVTFVAGAPSSPSCSFSAGDVTCTIGA